MIRKASILLLATILVVACATGDPNQKAKQGAGAGAAAGAVIGANFRNYPDEQVTVEGHTDSVGTPFYNQTLSEQRASAVSTYLIDEGVPSPRITSIGYGETRPKASNDTPEGRQLNRRVEIHIRAT